MRRILFLPVFAVFLAASLPAAAEEILMKDGTKIVGHMAALQPDKIEVETAYGKMQLKRADIISINFPENGSLAAPGSPAAKDAAINVEESLRGTQYVNKTGKFTLTVPQDWKISQRIQRSAPIVTVLSSHDDMRFLLVSQEEYSGSLESYKGLLNSHTAERLGATKSFRSLRSRSTVNLDYCFRFAGFRRSPIICRCNSLWPSSLQAVPTLV